MELTKILDKKTDEIIKICNLEVNEHLTEQDKRRFIRDIVVKIYFDCMKEGYNQALKEIKEAVNNL